MTLTTYIDKLQVLVRNNPELAVMPVHYARDDEGNGYSPVVYNPSAVRLEDGEVQEEGTVNAVIIN
jgi:hypothetical protein